MRITKNGDFFISTGNKDYLFVLRELRWFAGNFGADEFFPIAHFNDERFNVFKLPYIYRLLFLDNE